MEKKITSFIPFSDKESTELYSNIILKTQAVVARIVIATGIDSEQEFT